jgi:hypothetical protein
MVHPNSIISNFDFDTTRFKSGISGEDMENTSGTHEFTSGVAQSYIFFLSTKNSFLSFFVRHYIVSLSSIYELGILFWYLQTVLRIFSLLAIEMY